MSCLVLYVTFLMSLESCPVSTIGGLLSLPFLPLSECRLRPDSPVSHYLPSTVFFSLSSLFLSPVLLCSMYQVFQQFFPRDGLVCMFFPCYFLILPFAGSLSDLFVCNLTVYTCTKPVYAEIKTLYI